MALSIVTLVESTQLDQQDANQWAVAIGLWLFLTWPEYYYSSVTLVQ